MKKSFLLLCACFVGVFVSPGSSVKLNIVEVSKKKKNAVIQYGIASYYNDKFQDRKTATGEQFDQKQMTAAHNSVPMNTWIKVTNLYNRKSIIVRVNDRLHPQNKRLVDLSLAAARKLDYLSRGLTKVKVEVFGKKKPL